MENPFNYKCRHLNRKCTSPNTKWLNHEYVFHQEKGLRYFRRDGVDWFEVGNVQTDINLKDNLPRLTIECYANIKQFKNDNMLKFSREGLCDYSIEYDEGRDTCKIYRNGEYLEDVVAFEILNDSNRYLTKIRLTVIGKVKIEWDQSIYEDNLKKRFEEAQKIKQEEHK